MKKEIDFSVTVDLLAEGYQLSQFPKEFNDERIDGMLIPHESIEKRVRALAREISADHP